jgi:glycosyltransferase involved in cell wall biosynthesis
MSPPPKINRICVLPRLSGVGGMVSFQDKLTEGLARRGVEVVQDLKAKPYLAVLVIGGSRDLIRLWRTRRQGIPLIHRLDGMNWIHRVRRTSLRHTLRAESGNFLLSLIRGKLADQVVYQSQFARQWWERAQGVTRTPWQVIHNGVDLSTYTPQGNHERPDDRFRVLLVEGSLMGGYETGLEHAVRLAEGLANRLDAPVELAVAGSVSARVREHWSRQAQVPILWLGLVPPERIPEIDRSAHLLFSADLNPACPNAVIEALACGLPVVAFDTGALGELVTGESGALVPYGGDPWQLDSPDLPSLIEAASAILTDQPGFRAGARRRAETVFSLDTMVDRYLEIIRDSGGRK